MADIKDFRLPDLGEGLEEGEIVEWHVEVGEVIALNQPVASVETAKAVVEVPSPFAGRVVERIGELGRSLEVGTVFLRIDVADAADAGDGGDDDDGDISDPGDGDDADGADDAGDGQASAATPSRSTGLDADEEPQPLVGYGQSKGGAGRRRRRGAPAPEAGGNGAAPAAKPLAKPPVRKLAKDLGVDLSAIGTGSGPGGVITRDDVHAAASTSPEEEPETLPGAQERREPVVAGFRGRRPGEVEQIRGIRKRIVEKMEVSRRTIPEATCSTDADLTELWALRKVLTQQARDEGHDVKITPFALLMRATVVGLRRFPTLNARIDREAGEIHLLEHVNLGFAADTERGLMVPNIKDAQSRSLVELATQLRDLAGQARDGSIGPGDLTGGTFTVNNYGAFGNDDGVPIINHPEAAILGIGAIRERPWVVDGELAVRRVARLTLSFDHRVCDGGEAGRFVTYVAQLCERPSRLLLHC